MNKYSINQRLRDFLKFKNISNEDYLKAIGVNTKAQVSNWLTLKEPIAAKHLIATITAYKELNGYWLLTGEGKMIAHNEYDSKEKLNEVNEPFIYGKCALCTEKDKRIIDKEEIITGLKKQIELLESSLGKNLKNGSR